MTPERWRRVTEVFHIARARDAAARVAFLDEVCADDVALRSEVEELLAADGAAGGFGETMVLATCGAPTRFATGTRVGPYEIVAFLAAGGMGEVYRARDMRLGRNVALKVLPDAFARDAERLARFKHEARVLAALNHPHIGTLYGLEEVDGFGALILELVEGPTLAERVSHGPLPLADTLTIARQIADALAAAHDRGVIHRDLKPANIQLTPAGDVKILDFGLAKVFADAGGASPAATDIWKDDGLIRGTAAYMSPEQARGRQLDKRTDIWAFGCVLYEMATGRMAFTGETVSDTIAAILDREPDWSALAPGTPASLRRVIGSCLEKDVKLRRRDAADLALDIDTLVRDRYDTPASEAGRGPRSRSVLTLTAVTVLLAAAFAAGLWLASPVAPATSGPLMQASIELPADAPLALGTYVPTVGFDRPAIALSPDGRLLAYVGQSSSGSKLYLRDLGTQDVAPLNGTEGAVFAFFSPDSRWLGFLTSDKVKKVPVTGGFPVTLCNAYNPGVASWLRDDTIYFSENQDKRISRVSAAGGTAAVVSAASGFSAMLPDGKRALINPRAGGISHDYADVSLVSLETGESKVVLRSAYNARYVEPGYIVFGRGGNLFAAAFDTVRDEVSANPILIASGAMMESVWGQAQFAISDTGMIAYVPGGDRSVGRLAWVDREGNTEFLPTPPRVYGVVRLSPNGEKLAAHVGDVTDYVWMYDFARAESQRMAAGDHSGFPNWAPDSLTVAFAGWKSFGQYRLALRAAEGGEIHELLAPSNETGYPTSVSPDGEAVALNTNQSWISIATRDGRVDRLDREAVISTLPDFSPDGRFFAYGSPEGSENEVFVRSYPDGRIIRQISANGGLEPLWCRCGELFFRKADRWMSVKIRTTPELQWEPARPAFQTDFVDTPGRSYDISADGQRLLIVKRAQPDTRNRINLLINWPAALTELGRGGR